MEEIFEIREYIDDESTSSIKRTELLNVSKELEMINSIVSKPDLNTIPDVENQEGFDNDAQFIRDLAILSDKEFYENANDQNTSISNTKITKHEVSTTGKNGKKSVLGNSWKKGFLLGGEKNIKKKTININTAVENKSIRNESTACKDNEGEKYFDLSKKNTTITDRNETAKKIGCTAFNGEIFEKF